MDIDYVQASAGTGEAVRAAVTVKRTAGSTTLTMDSVNNWPTKFIATSGLEAQDGTLDPTTVQVFKGHLSAQNIIIDEFAPGYTDLGNSVGEIVVIKPTTLWSDTFHGWATDTNTAIADINTALENDGLVFSTSATQPSPVAGKTVVWFEPLS